MAAYRSPKPLVGVRVPGGTPNLLVKSQGSFNRLEREPTTDRKSMLLRVLNFSVAEKMIRIYSLGDHNAAYKNSMFG